MWWGCVGPTGARRPRGLHKMADTTQTQTTAASAAGGDKPTAAAKPNVVREESAAALNDPTLDFERMLAEELGGPEEEGEDQAGETGKPRSTEGAGAEADEDPLQAELDAEDDPAEEEAETEPEPEQPEKGEEGKGEEEEEPESAADESEEGAEDDHVPRGMEGWPKQAIKRIRKQSEQIAGLKEALAQAGATAAATPLNPLADVADIEALEKRIAGAKARRAWCLANPEGGTLDLGDGSHREVSAELAQSTLARAEAELEAYPDAKIRLAERLRAKPWLEAEKYEPKLLTKGTHENTFYENVLRAVPELRRLADFEVLLAAATRGMRQIHEEAKGVARYVRYELKDGKIVPPKANAVKQPANGKAPAGAGKAAPKAPAQQTPISPQTQRPPQRTAGAPSASRMKALEQKATDGDEGAFAELLAAELEAA